MTEIVRYIIRFMVGECFTDDVCRLIGYTSEIACFADYKIVIMPSDFFDEGIYGTLKSQPVLPLHEIENVPILFGTPDIERVGDTIVVHADLVASAYFLLSRYEEMIHRDKRDKHGRFPGRESLPYQAAFIDRPIVDEYGKLLRKWLHLSGATISEQAPSIRQINLTHDVDEPFNCRTWRNVARHTLSGRNPFLSIRDKFSPLQDDLYYTFPWMLQQDNMLQHAVGEDNCQSFLFFKAGGKTKNDKPRYDLYGKDIGALFALCREQHATVGLHSSFEAGMDHSLIASEKKKLENAYGAAIKHNRNHFLSSREPEDMEYIENVGITDDYTMGYADVAGFRIGTSLPVRFINPTIRRLTTLTLHPLIIMDGTLHEPHYMNLTADRAEDYCMRLIQNIRQVNGELTLLWHNTTVIENKGRDLYSKIINYLAYNK